MRHHPLADIFPMLEGEELHALAKDIEENGLLEPAVVLDGMILDGRNRAAACDLADIELRTVQWGDDPAHVSPLAFVVSKNLTRRQLTSSQRAAIAVELLPELEAEAKERQGARSDLNFVEKVPQSRSKARDRAADLTGTNPRYVQDAKKVAEADPELFEQVKAGATSVREAAKTVAAAKDKERKRKSDAIRADKRRKDEEAPPGLAVLNQGDFRTHVEALEPGSVDLILTDPPYGAGFQSGFRWATDRADKIKGDESPEQAVELAVTAVEALMGALSATGHVLVFCRWVEEPMLREALSNIQGLELRGSLVWVKNEPGMGDLKGTFGPAHERILHLARPDAVMRIREGDVIEAARAGTKNHPTEKPVELLSRLICALTEPGALVADPFAGSASTLAAAVQAGRKGWGCELDEQYAAKARERLDAAA